MIDEIHKLKDLIYEIDLLDEGINSAYKLNDKNIEHLKPNDWVIVYHGTYIKSNDRERGPQNIVFGIDAVSKHYRHYTGSEHSGLFVAPSKKYSRKFGPLIFEIAVRAKNLHGTDYGGNIGRAMDQEFVDNLRAKYPKSFRPTLTNSLKSKNGEPQALYIGTIGPHQFIKVYYKGNSYTVDEYIKEFSEFLKRGHDSSFNITSTRMSVDDLFSYTSSIMGNISNSRIEKTFLRVIDGGDSAIAKFLKSSPFSFSDMVVDSLIPKLKKWSIKR